MKSIKDSLSSLLTALCYSFLSLLGFSCSSADDPVMYGMPTGDFEIKGTVTDEDGAEVANAEIRFTSPHIPSGIESLQTTTTNSEGKYIAEGESYGLSEMKIVCIPSDSGLEADSVVIKLHYNRDNAGTWYAGEAKETVDFKLKPKDSEDK